MDRASSYHLSIRHDFCLDFNIFDYLSFAAGWLVGWLVSYSQLVDVLSPVNQRNVRIPNKTLTNKQQEQEQGEKGEEQEEQQMHGALTLMTREIYYGLQSNEANGFTAQVCAKHDCRQ